jgi:hypothetical protein
MPPFPKTPTYNCNGFKPYPVPAQRGNIAMDVMIDAQKSRFVMERRRQMGRIAEAHLQSLTEFEKSKFILEMRGQKGRCRPCFKGKGGKVYSSLIEVINN